MTLLDKIQDRTASIVVIGLGYVGLPLAVEFATAGFTVIGYDTDEQRVWAVNGGVSHIQDVPSTIMTSLVESQKLVASSSSEVLDAADIVIICVPTPLNKTKGPDLRHIISATEAIEKNQHAEMLVILESTTYPGTTRELIGSKLGLAFELEKDVFIAFSPERVDPGNKTWTTKKTPKVVGALGAESLKLAVALYETAIDTVVPVNSAEAAEMAKILENTFRAVNIGLVNEIAIMCDKLKIDVWEVVRAASTKPFGFMPFYPGPGLGGHCIPVDPLYLSWKMRALNYHARFIDLADSVNSDRPAYIVQRVQHALNEQRKAVKGSSILVSGVAYKRDTADSRESPALDIIVGLQALGATVQFHDEFVQELKLDGLALRSVSDPKYEIYDAVVVVADHTNVAYTHMAKMAQLVVDTRNIVPRGPKVVTV